MVVSVLSMESYYLIKFLVDAECWPSAKVEDQSAQHNTIIKQVHAKYKHVSL